MSFKYFLLLLSFLFSGLLSAQSGIEMADRMRAEGKIYIVVAVIAIVFIGIVAYLVRLDRKITRLEQHEKQQE